MTDYIFKCICCEIDFEVLRGKMRFRKYCRSCVNKKKGHKYCPKL